MASWVCVFLFSQDYIFKTSSQRSVRVGKKSQLAEEEKPIQREEIMEHSN